MRHRRRRRRRVFLNAPFDSKFKPILDAIVFAVLDCGCNVHCALEASDSGEWRMDKICALIEACDFGVHDISRVEPDGRPPLPRFNMPLELGLFMGARRFGGRRHRAKKSLVLDELPHRYKRSCSDLAGCDISAHHGSPDRAIVAVRNWMSNQLSSPNYNIPGPDTMVRRYRSFVAALPKMCRLRNTSIRALTFLEYRLYAAGWIAAESKRKSIVG